MASGKQRSILQTSAGQAAPLPEALLIDLIEEIEYENDARRAYVRVQQQLSDYRAKGVAAPEQLLAMERALAMECTAESQGR